MQKAVLAAILAWSGLQGLADQTVAGRVLRDGTRSPIEGARISLTRLHPDLPLTDAAVSSVQSLAYYFSLGGSSPASLKGFLAGATFGTGLSEELLKPLSAATAVTDPSGSFSFRDLPTGRYALVVRHDSFFNPDAGSRNPEMVARIITIEPGVRPPALDLFMVEGGMISGRIRDPGGNPAAKIIVGAYQPSYRDGVLSWESAGVGALTDDRGEYRLHPLRAGQYLVDVGPPPGASNLKWEDSWARTLYPGTEDALTALPVTIKLGEEARAINIDILKTEPERTYRVSGTAINPLPSLRPNPATGAVDRSIGSFYLVSRERSLLDPDRFPTAISNAIPAGSRPNGEFEIRNVKPGAYDLYATYLDPTVGRYFISRTPVDVLDQDVKGLSIALSLGGTLETQVTTEGGAVPPLRLDSLELEFDTADTTPRTFFAGLDSGQKLDAEGRITIRNFPEARYRFSLKGLPVDAYIADIRHGGRSVYDEGVVVGQQLETVQISVRTDSGAVTGSVERSGKGIQKATVILVPPATRRKNPQLFRTETTNEKGEFSVRGILPGVYKILALRSLPPGEPWLNETFLAPFLQSAQELRIEARSTVPVRLELIATP